MTNNNTRQHGNKARHRVKVGQTEPSKSPLFPKNTNPNFITHYN